MTEGPSSVQRDDMFLLHQGLVRAIAWRTHQRLPRTVELDDLVAYGQIGLLEAIAAFDARRGSKFTTYAWHRIRGSILDGLDAMDWFDRAAYEGGRYAPDGAETPNASAHGGEGGGSPAPVPSRADSPPSPAGAAYRGRPVRTDFDASIFGGTASDAGEASLHLELVMALRDLLATLPARQAALVRGTFYEGRTLTESARRLGISVAWASRLQTRTLADLRIALERLGYG